jgi:predicted ATPase with chaperone activity
LRRDAVEGLRQPLEDGRVVVTRIVGSVSFLAQFTRGGGEPCPCGSATPLSREGSMSSAHTSNAGHADLVKFLAERAAGVPHTCRKRNSTG